jgi:hypothetical protein
MACRGQIDPVRARGAETELRAWRRLESARYHWLMRFSGIRRKARQREASRRLTGHSWSLRLEGASTPIQVNMRADWRTTLTAIVGLVSVFLVGGVLIAFVSGWPRPVTIVRLARHRKFSLRRQIPES